MYGGKTADKMVPADFPVINITIDYQTFSCQIPD